MPDMKTTTTVTADFKAHKITATRVAEFLKLRGHDARAVRGKVVIVRDAADAAALDLLDALLGREYRAVSV